MQPQTIADIAGDNAKHALGASGTMASLILLTAVGGPARYGDTNVGSARGVELPSGVQVTIPQNTTDRVDRYDLGQIYVYVPSGTTLTGTWQI
jgi:hypothetical protein